MLYIGIFKRVIPFVLTFAFGLFLASLLTSSAVPALESPSEGRRGKCRRDKTALLMEVDRLEQEIRSVKQENSELRRKAATSDWTLEEAVPPVEVEHPPAPPKRPKHPRFDR